MTNPSRTAMDQDAFPNSESRTDDQRLPRGPANQAQACRLEMAERTGFCSDNVFVRNVVFGIASRPVEYLRRVPDFVSWREHRHAGADCFDHSGYVMTGNGRQWHQVAIVTAPDLVIQGIDRRRMDAHQDLSRMRNRRRHVAKFERFRAAKRVKYHRFHCKSSFR